MAEATYKQSSDINASLATGSIKPSIEPPSSRLRRSWLQRATIAAVIVSSISCFGAASALVVGQWIVNGRQVVNLRSSSMSRATDPAVAVNGERTELDPNGKATETLVLAEPEAANFLVTGADSGDCAGSDDPTAVGRSSSRSDTIMVWRINPESKQLAVLSFPRDLWVELPNGHHSKINSAYEKDNPTELIETIGSNFGVPVDHYIQVDFCAFRTLVNAVDGVEVPFAYPARDPASLLDVPTTGCVRLDGDMALSYVRSRHYQYEKPPGSGNWRTDGTSDYGRIARQQDFLRRMVAKVVSGGLYSPSVATGLIETNSEYLVTDSQLTVRRMLEFANTLRTINSANIGSYRIEATSDHISGQSVERPRIDGENMQAILKVFQGHAVITDAPEQQFATTTTTTPDTTNANKPTTKSTSSPSKAANPTNAPSSTNGPTDSAPQVGIESNNTGIFPNPNTTCS